MPAVTKIVITGGPCAGKTTALTSIQAAFSRLGYKVVTVPEPATEFISNGVTPWECSSAEEYQWCQMRVQLTRERAFVRAVDGMDEEKVLIVCDRGMLDNRCYMTEEEFQRVIADFGCNEFQLRDDYDAVFHLVSAAKGAEEYYGTESNGARYESLEEAAALDDKFIESWTGHPYLRVIDNSTDFAGKMRRLIQEISLFLGESASYVVQRRFLIEYPDIEGLESLPNCERVEITQHYLRSDETRELRIRKRGTHDWNTFYLTEMEIDGARRHLVRRERISLREYETLLTQADPARRPIEMTRFCLTYAGQYFEIDVYPYWDDQAIIQIELPDEQAPIHFPPQVKVIREISDDASYRNSVMATMPWGTVH